MLKAIFYARFHEEKGTEVSAHDTLPSLTDHLQAQQSSTRYPKAALSRYQTRQPRPSSTSPPSLRTSSPGGDEIGRLLAATATPKDKGTPEPKTTGSLTRTVETTRTPTRTPTASR